MIVTLEEAKGYLRVDYDDDDELIESFIAAAEHLVADVTRVEITELTDGFTDKFRIATLYTTAHLYEHREEADHNALALSLRSFLCGERKAGF